VHRVRLSPPAGGKRLTILQMGMIRCRKNSPRKRGEESPIIPSQMRTAREDFGFVVKAGGLHNPDLAEGILAESKKAGLRARPCGVNSCMDVARGVW
jgi:hypothetical protein